MNKKYIFKTILSHCRNASVYKEIRTKDFYVSFPETIRLYSRKPTFPVRET
ncbi:hypothetical protein BACPLE_02181 [Phocaeicola plebeius DSM 17135]|uniref:Uncharacterized protein n=1 Tax=Phocaeicola plebeius (strain DSM 17135 / JCM 12973 / CCUG 54634 / M2) TaxID=484018 RepID=B5CZL5_PHOPM|nr:hypothetical protein BACPLE_02181 [Phocaeicola plebeius DSM 17135]